MKSKRKKRISFMLVVKFIAIGCLMVAVHDNGYDSGRSFESKRQKAIRTPYATASSSVVKEIGAFTKDMFQLALEIGGK